MTIELLHPDIVNDVCQELAALLTRHTKGKGNGAHPTAINQLDFARSDLSGAIPSVYEPRLCIVVQGKKAALLAFHRHFKEVTSMSPLQYQKQLRLLAARHLMLSEKFDAVNAAY